jgi:(4S)-4-hydroxy-5-phosphonooxypentane-2,3-dione isomerase
MSEQAGGHILLVKFRAKAGQEREFAKRMQSTIPGTRAEPGNRQFEFYVDQADPLNFMLYEEFADEAALKIHQARPEMGVLLETIKPMLDNPPEVTMWRPALTNAGKNGHKPEAVGHVTLVRFRMKADGVERMLAAVGGDLDHMQGNIRFDLNRSQKDPLDAMICARWVSRAVWEAHNAQPEFKTFVDRTAPCLDTPMQRTLWKPVAA